MSVRLSAPLLKGTAAGKKMNLQIDPRPHTHTHTHMSSMSVEGTSTKINRFLRPYKVKLFTFAFKCSFAGAER